MEASSKFTSHLSFSAYAWTSPSSGIADRAPLFAQRGKQIFAHARYWNCSIDCISGKISSQNCEAKNSGWIRQRNFRYNRKQSTDSLQNPIACESQVRWWEASIRGIAAIHLPVHAVKASEHIKYIVFHLIDVPINRPLGRDASPTEMRVRKKRHGKLNSGNACQVTPSQAENSSTLLHAAHTCGRCTSKRRRAHSAHTVAASKAH